MVELAKEIIQLYEERYDDIHVIDDIIVFELYVAALRLVEDDTINLN
jgi:hypothetical protein